MMFGERCYGYAGCGHNVNWTCSCTCDEEIARDTSPTLAAPIAQPLCEIDQLKARIEGMALYVAHDTGCEANDLDYLDKTPCTCGLRQFYNPKGAPHQHGAGNGEKHGG